MYRVILNIMMIQLPDNLELDNEFWQFSLALWQKKEVQETLLRLQDKQSFRINLLLFSMWLGLERKIIEEHLELLVQTTKPWHQQVVIPLRTVRQTIPKQLPNPALKPQIQSSELLAEQIEQALLFSCAQKISKKDQKIRDNQTNDNTLYTLTSNLLACSTHHQTSTLPDKLKNKSGKLDQSDLLLLIQACLPIHPVSHISACIDSLTAAPKA